MHTVRILRFVTVAGGWSNYSDPSPCSMSCGGGVSVKVRTCTSPAPDPEGQPCEGQNNETTACNEDPCPGGVLR